MREPNYERLAFEGTDPSAAAVLTDQQAAMFAGIKKLESELYDRKHDSRWSSAQNRDFMDRRLHELQVEFYESNAAMYQKLTEQLDQAREAFIRKAEADPTRLLLQQQRYLTRYQGMTRAQLEAEAQSYAEEQDADKVLKDWSTDRLDALTAALTKQGKPPDYFEAAKQAKHYDQPWVLERQAEYQALECYRPEYGRATVINAFGNPEKVDIKKLLVVKTEMENEK